MNNFTLLPANVKIWKFPSYFSRFFIFPEWHPCNWTHEYDQYLKIIQNLLIKIERPDCHTSFLVHRFFLWLLFPGQHITSFLTVASMVIPKVNIANRNTFLGWPLDIG